MTKAATDVMHAVIFSAVLDAVEALKAASKGLPNQLVRDLQTIHANTTFADLPKPVQDSITSSVRSAFTQFLKDGYAVGPKQQMQQSRPMDRVPERDRGPRPHGPGGERRGPHGPGGERRGPRPPGRGPRPGGRPGGGKPRG